MIAAGVGVLLAAFSIVSQGGYARGYASVLSLFVVFALWLGAIVAAIVAFAIKNGHYATELIVSAFILPATFLLILFLVRTFNRE